MKKNEQENGDSEGTPKWYEEIINEPPNKYSITEQVLIELKDEAKRCHDAEVNNYNIKNSKTNWNYQWMKTVMNNGTVSDKIAAHTVAIQDNPICNLETLKNLVNMVKVGKKKECLSVMETLTELFLSDLLKPDMKLKPFCTKPLFAITELSSGNAIKRRKILSMWYFEDQLKDIYNVFIQSLNIVAQDTVESNKEKALTAMYKLLAGNPEQEKNLLANIINKLGDPSQKVVSKAIYCLSQLLFQHPNMQEVVLKEVEKLLFRPNIGSKAQYYSLCFLSQFYFSHDTQPVAKKIIELYLSFFKACVKKGDIDSRMMSALLMGINRAYPYANIQFEDMAEHIETLYRLVHLSSFNISVQVLMLLYHVSSDKMIDRFFSTLYKKLTDAKLLTTTHQAMLLSLLYKSLLKDDNSARTKMFIKRLLQISLYVQPSFASGILYLISRLISRNSELEAFVLQEGISPDLNDLDSGEEKYYDIKDEKEEPEIEAAGELELTLVSSPQTLDTETVEIKDDPDDVKPDVSFQGSSWYHATDKQQEKRPVSKYNPHARNPLYGGGSFATYNELFLLQSYFHPTVALFSRNILKRESTNYGGDPLKDFTLIRFLDRFVFKNPKRSDDRFGAHPTFGKRKFYKPKGVKTMSVNSKSYLNEDQKNIPADEVFLHSYVQNKYRNKSLREANDDSDLESVQSEEFEEMLDRMAGVKDESGNDNIDYMGEIGDNLKNKPEKSNKRKHMQEEEDEKSEDEEANEGSDLEEGSSLDEDSEDVDSLVDLSDDDDDDEDMEFLSSDEENTEKLGKKNKKLPKKKDKNAFSSLFASADDFASLLEDEGSSKQKLGSSNQMENKDQASQKQLDWEGKRDQWVKGFNKAIKAQRGPRFCPMKVKNQNKKTKQNRNKK